VFPLQGGSTLDLQGGEYLLSAPMVVPAGFGNVRLSGGTLRASPSFPVERYLVEVGENSCVPPTSQGVCNEYVVLEDLFLDAAHTAAGGVNVIMTMGTTFGPSAFVTGFTQAVLSLAHLLITHKCGLWMWM